MLKLLGYASPNMFKVLLMLRELDLDYAFESVPLFGEALSTPAFRKRELAHLFGR